MLFSAGLLHFLQSASPNDYHKEMTDIDWSECAIVETDPEKMGGIPTVRAFRLSADSVVENHDDGVTPEEIAYMFHVPLQDVTTILAYAEQARTIAHPV